MIEDSPAVVLYDENGFQTAVTAGVVLPVSTSGYVGAGVDDSGTVRYWRLSSGGEMFVTGSLTANVSVGAVAQGNSGSIGQSWFFTMTDGTKPIGVSPTAAVWVTGSTSVTVNTTASVTAIPQATSSVVLSSASLLRQGGTIYNYSTSNLFVKMGVSASISPPSFTTMLTPGSMYETLVNYSGLITGVWDASGSGYAMVTEIKP